MSERRGTLPVDWIFVAFQALVVVVLVWRRDQLPSWPAFLATNLLAAALVPLLARAPRSGFIRFIGAVYAALLTPLFYTQLGLIATETGLVHDQVVQGWEAALFGGQVSMTWHQVMPSATLSWVLHGCYGIYIGVVIFALVFLALRRAPDDLARGAFTVALGFYVCYAVFLLYPVAGPRYFFGTATGGAAEVLPARLVHRMLEGGSAWGTAFPSSHIVASWCAVASLWRPARRLALVLWPVVLCLALGTVYGQFHYGVDAVAGVVLAAGLIAAAAPLYRALGPGAAGAVTSSNPAG